MLADSIRYLFMFVILVLYFLVYKYIIKRSIISY